MPRKGETLGPGADPALLDTPREAEFRRHVRSCLSAGKIPGPTELNQLMGLRHQQNVMSGRNSKIRIYEYEQAGLSRRADGRWVRAGE
jgi:hypothetical protein